MKSKNKCNVVGCINKAQYESWNIFDEFYLRYQVCEEHVNSIEKRG